MKKLLCWKYHTYTKSENQKYYLYTCVILNINIRQPNLTKMYFIWATKCIEDS